MNHKSFTKTAMLLILMMLAATPISSQNIGLQLYSLRDEFKKDVEGTLKQISDWGISYLEGGETYGLERTEFQELLSKYNLNVVSIGATYEALSTDPKSIVENAKSYGAKYVMCSWIPHKGNTFTINNVKKAVALFNEVGQYFAEEGITLAYHPHGYEFRPYADGTLFNYMAENAEDFKFEMDVYWVKHGGANPLELLDMYPEKFVLMHLKDMRRGTEGNNTGSSDVETNVILGTGQVEIAAIVEKARELEIEYLFIEDESSRVISQIPQSLMYLKKL